MVPNQKEVNERLADELRQASAAVIAVYLFGSQARVDARPDSDIDVAVLLSGSGHGTLVGPLTELSGRLERVLGRTVDLIDLRTAPPDLVHRVLRDGELLLERDPDERVAFEVRSRNEYFDLLPHLERYRRHRAA
jgi:hypothetical protein